MSDSLAERIAYATDTFWFYINIFILIVGFIGNLSLILIFITLRVFRGNQCAFLLTVESFSNIGFLLSTSPITIHKYITGQDSTLPSIVWCKLQISMSHAFGLCSLFTVCFLTFDQYMSTNPRPHFRQISSLKLVHHLTFVNGCFALLHSIIFIIFIDIQEMRCTITNHILFVYVTYFYYPILHAAAPFIITLTLSVLAYRNVRRIIRRQINVIRRRLDRQLTAMILARVWFLIIFGLPYIGLSLFRLNFSITDGDQLRVAIFRLAATITYSLLYINFAVKYKAIFLK